MALKCRRRLSLSSVFPLVINVIAFTVLGVVSSLATLEKSLLTSLAVRWPRGPPSNHLLLPPCLSSPRGHAPRNPIYFQHLPSTPLYPNCLYWSPKSCVGSELERGAVMKIRLRVIDLAGGNEHNAIPGLLLSILGDPSFLPFSFFSLRSRF